MKLDATSILLAACCAFALTLPSCSIMERKASAKPAAVTPRPQPPPPPPPDTASQLPISVPQTQVTLPSPQPIQAEALATILPDTPPPPEPANPAAKPPRPAAARPEPRQQANVPPPQPEAPPPATPTPSRRLRPVETPAERQRLMAGINAQQQKVQDVLTKAKSRQLSDAEKNAVERIQAFLEQTTAALKDQDLQQADALSKRALLLSQEVDK